ncbi:MAG: hypothetical protein COU27_01695 [Candidatus Levybacteria bacterium CG10_big_fil_rev_8_21_14_0_10_36_7]|nr:MAG: hypothetical protein COU27_01695 [Candidatus Levybacteria bacterium CG10_big_fil_rev_8_21_14_0_10_36_7]
MRKSTSIVVYIVDAVFSVIGVLLGLRVVLRLLGANSSAPFVGWVYETTQPLLTPFQGIFPLSRIDGGFTIEFSAIFALIIYSLVGYVILQAIDELVYLSRRRENKKS